MCRDRGIPNRSLSAHIRLIVGSVRLGRMRSDLTTDRRGAVCTLEVQNLLLPGVMYMNFPAEPCKQHLPWVIMSEQT